MQHTQFFIFFSRALPESLPTILLWGSIPALKLWEMKLLPSFAVTLRLLYHHQFFQPHFCKYNWYFVTKIVLTDCEKKLLYGLRKTFANSRLKAENLQNVWDCRIEFEEWSVLTIFETEYFLTCYISDIIHWNN